ncbi:tlde1 domain-containing protein, partial [Pseudomonas aeruginosa]|uniref:tlde1 domain-containing protein n=4 Tax=Bacteria TaxID=2 RepID=UPI00402BCCCD
IYEMKPREKLFHGVPALRMTPVDGSDTFGRVGLLVHSYMLGPNGDSNGCISVKHYDKFLQAYRSGTVRRIAVVISIKDVKSASTRA